MERVEGSQDLGGEEEVQRDPAKQRALVQVTVSAKVLKMAF